LALLAADIDIKKWHALIHEFVIKAVEQIKPSSKLLNDSMNLNDFVKIKLIPWKDNSRSQYINGVVITKNLADRRMLSQISNPNILLLKNTQDIGFTDLQSEID
jgi:1-phosphatidylinositol-3-phosphate 5-kinase